MSFDGIKAFGQLAALNPKKKELDKAMAHASKATGLPINKLKTRDILNSYSQFNKKASDLISVGDSAGRCVASMKKPSSSAARNTEKSAQYIQDVYGMEKESINRMVGGALAGAGVGAGIGYLSTRDKNHKRRAALIGAGVGASSGGLAGALSQPTGVSPDVLEQVRQAGRTQARAEYKQAVEKVLRSRGLM